MAFSQIRIVIGIATPDMEYKIPLFDLNYDETEERAVIETLRSKWISTGPKTTEFEATFAKALGARHAIALANCTVALHLAFHTLNIQPGDEVICPSLTFIATVNALRYVGATPVFCDVTSTSDLTMDPVHLQSLVSNKTRAIVVMHYGGFPCNMAPIMDVAGRKNIAVIEDASHGPLSEYHGKKLGTIGLIGCFSFFSNKNISTGEGGMLVTDDDAIAARVRSLRSHGMTTLSYERSKGHTTEYDVLELGFNYRMDDIRAALGLVQLAKLQPDLKARASLRHRYLSGLSEIDDIVVPFNYHEEFVSNYIFPIVLRDSNVHRRDTIRQALKERGIQTSVHYPPVHRFHIYRQYQATLPTTEYVGENEITLPLFSRMTVDQVDLVVQALKDALAWARRSSS